MTSITLTGLRADNPLAFLAALGTLRVLTLARPDDPPRMGWAEHAGAWRPVLEFSGPMVHEALIAEVDGALHQYGAQPALGFAKDTCVAPDVFAGFVKQAASAANRADRRCADFAAAFGCEVFADSQGRVSDTALRTMSGAGNQHFIAFMQELCECTEQAHLKETLFGPWRWRDERPSMRWDPSDDRRYALRWKNPSGDKITTVRGANRLAVEAMPLFTTVPRSRGLETVGFAERDWYWPIWVPRLSLDCVRSILTGFRSKGGIRDRSELEARGIVAVFQSTRITVGQFRNFSPARAVE